MLDLDALTIHRKTGDEKFTSQGLELDLFLRDYWSWSASDLLNNTMRGILAEFIVASALGLDLKTTSRKDWEPIDIETEEGVKIEVKSAAYLQSWKQKNFSKIRFGIRQTAAWSEDSGYAKESKRQADIYVFCVLDHKEKQTINPLNLDQWEFYILQSSMLNEKAGRQKSISLSGLCKLNSLKAKYHELSEVLKGIRVPKTFDD